VTNKKCNEKTPTKISNKDNDEKKSSENSEKKAVRTVTRSNVMAKKQE